MPTTKNNPQIVVIGGGAAGFFGAIRCAELLPQAKVIILERGKEVLQKVKISGGGRCNLTHACFQARDLVRYYPRGEKALLGPFHRFQAQDTLDWFAVRGVKTKAEADGRMFPTSDSSQTIIDCFWREVKRLGIEVRVQERVTGIARQEEGFAVQLATGDSLSADALLIATGSQSTVWEWLQRDWGLEIVPPVPSLFTFNIHDRELHALAGLSVPLAKLDFPANKKLQAQGPLLITHWGLSGPAVLRLSAWGARWLHEQDYRSTLRVNWLGEATMAEIQADLQEFKEAHPKKTLGSQSPFAVLPQRLWAYLLHKAGVPAQGQWANLSKAQAQALQQNLGQCAFAVEGKSTFKEEFVTAGGLALSEIDFSSFQAKKIPKMFFAGEVLDIDAITGGFNFQAAWTGAWLAAQGIANALQKDV